MTIIGWLQAALLIAALVLTMKPLGAYMARLFAGERVFLSPVFAPVERLVYRVCGIDATAEMTWSGYAFALLAFSFIGFIFLYVLLQTQAWLPFNPQHFANLSPDLAWNTAISFLTNTNWQFYSGESTMSYLTQMAGLAWHNFVSAGAGIAVAIAVIRGVSRSSTNLLGNFWVDLTRATLYVLLPVAFLAAIFLAWQGVPQNMDAYHTIHTVEGATQTITGGPMASQESIKEFGTNGGGFVNANSASPNENPNPLTNFVEMFLILAIGFALLRTYGIMVGDKRQGWAIFAAMAILLVVGFAGAYWAESAGNPIVHAMGVHGGNMEGKETRFGVAASTLFGTITTDTSTGAVDSMHDSFTPLGGLVPLVDMQLGEIVFGGVGSGLYGMLIFVVLTIFIAGLMVGRTPEFLGKKIEARDVRLAILAVLVTPVLSLVPTAIAVLLPAGLATLNNAGPHGFSEILYAFTSANANNGSAFAGLGGNTFFDIAMGVTMFFGRFAVAIPALALAGSLASKKSAPESAGTFRTYSPIFVVLLVGTIVIVGALTFLPADALGPIVEHLEMLQGTTY